MGGSTSVEEHVAGELSEEAAAAAIRDADAVVLLSGAGLGVDSGLGTFRGKFAGVWSPLRAMRLDFSRMSTPSWFDRDPRLAWAFWRFRHQAYTKNTPHDGYGIMAKWGASKKYGFFCVTSNIDGHWGRTPGITPEQVWECHGTLLYVHAMEGNQALTRTDDEMISGLQVPDWDVKPGDLVEVQLVAKDLHSGDEDKYMFDESAEWAPAKIDEDGASVVGSDGLQLECRAVRKPGGEDMMRVRAGTPLPTTPDGRPLRPAVLMFGDGGVNTDRIMRQRGRYDTWKAKLPHGAKVAVVEVGAGTALATIRSLAETLAADFPHATFVRVNPEYSGVPEELKSRSCSMARGALDAAKALAACGAV